MLALAAPALTLLLQAPIWKVTPSVTAVPSAYSVTVTSLAASGWAAPVYWYPAKPDTVCAVAV